MASSSTHLVIRTGRIDGPGRCAASRRNYNVNLGSNAGIAAALAAAEKFGFGPAHLDRFPARIAAVTTAEANAAMRRHFFADRLHVIVAGDLDAIPD